MVKKVLKVLFVESDLPNEYNCSLWRCVFPTRALKRAGYMATIVHIEDWKHHKPETDELSQAADFIILQRNLFFEVLPAIVYWRAKGKTVIVDVDDAYKYMTEGSGSPSYSFWIRGRILLESGQYQEVIPRPLDMLTYGTKLCNCLTAPSQVLCNDWASITNTYYFPNFIDHELYHRYEVYHPTNGVYFGWGGSMTHRISWLESNIIKALQLLFKERSEAHIIIVGDKKIYDMLPLPSSRKVYMNWTPHVLFPKLLSQFDVGLAPLAGEYDRRRSWLKSLEYTTLGIPWIGSMMEPNMQIPTGAVVDNSVEGWYQTLMHYMDDLTNLKAKAQASMYLGTKYSVFNNADYLMDLFTKIVEEVG